MPTIREEVPAALDGQRLDRVVAMLTGLSRTDAAALVGDGSAVVDGRPVLRGADRVAQGSVVEIDAPDLVVHAGVEAEPGIEVPVVHEDDDVLVVDKPAGLIVHPGSGRERGTMVAGLLARYPELAGVGDPERPGIVHRLDKGTSGLLMVARTSLAYDSLVAQLAGREVERRYRSLVWGHLDAVQGMIDAPIGRSARQPTRMAVSTRGKEARTRYDVVESFDRPVELAHIQCRLETGRTHQIRVHLSAIGHAVVGDDRYGGNRPVVPCPRPFLHAEHLAFTHPGTGDRLSFDSPLPADLQAVLDAVRAAQ